MPTPNSQIAPQVASQIVLREARRLHRAASSESLSTALPVLRRLINAGVMPTTSLPELFRRRKTVQRKHILRVLAAEAGYATWEAYRPVLDQMDGRELESFVVLEKGYATLNLWFASEAEARVYAAQNGGQVVRVGQQAVVLPSPMGDSAVEQGA